MIMLWLGGLGFGGRLVLPLPTLFQVLRLASAQSKRAEKAARDLEKLERELARQREMLHKLAEATGVEPLTIV